MSQEERPSHERVILARRREREIVNLSRELFPCPRCFSMADCEKVNARYVELFCLLSEDASCQWQADAAFYLLRAAFALADTPDEYARIRQVATFRREEPLITGEVCTCADHGVMTAIEHQDVMRGYRDSYAQLVDDCCRFTNGVVT